MRIAGIDPGTIRSGIGIIESGSGGTTLLFSNTIHAGAHRPLSERLRILFDGFQNAFEKWKPDVVVLENVFYRKDFKAAIKVGEARAAAMIAAEISGSEVVEYAPARIKQSVCGNGRAAKDQVQYMIRHLLKLRETLPPDSSDAVACALCHLNTVKNPLLAAKRVAHAL